MFNLKELIAYIRANNIAMSTPEEVRRGLISNEWSHDDIDAALVLLQSGGVFETAEAEIITDGEKPEENTDDIATAHTNLETAPDYAAMARIKTDAKLDPASINRLLGVNVNFTQDTKEVRRVLRTPRMTMSDQMVALLLACLLSAGILFGAMYYYQFGLFHHTSSFASYFK